MTQRQQVLVLYLADSALDARVVGWALYDGAAEGPVPPVQDRPEPPFATGLDALRDGWRLLQLSPLTAAHPGAERDVGYLRHEAVLEKLVDLDANPSPG